MKESPDISIIARLMGDAARAKMLTALMSGKALTASELADEAEITLQTASSHLSKLTNGGLIGLRKQGRHKYFSLENADIAKVLEGLMGIAAGTSQLRVRTGPNNSALRHARVCYNHLAGEMGTKLFDQLMSKNLIQKDDDEISVTDVGGVFFQQFGIDITSLQSKKPLMCREYLDWSERKSHLAGSLGRAILQQLEQRNWVQRQPDSRIILFSESGKKSLEQLLNPL